MENFTKASELKKQQEYEKSNKVLIELAALNPQDALINYQCAWSFDIRGMERS